MIYLTILIFLICLYTSLSLNTQNMHTVFTFVHNDPCILNNIFNISMPSYMITYCSDNNFNPIHQIEALDYSSFIHIERIVDDDCPFSHDTCSHYCHIYESCFFNDRIEYYLSNKIHVKSVGEVLLHDNHLNEINIITHFMNSKSHAEVIFDKRFNYYGMAHYDNVFNMNFLMSDSIIDLDTYEIKPCEIEFNNQKFLFTTIESCNTKNKLVYQKDTYYIYILS